ncbi:MAG: cell division protein ZapA [Clostridia bacterium]|nr:cell division protein ZapA [Clostridia bacterium]
MSKNMHEISIAGIGLSLSSDNSVEYVDKLAEDLTNKINKIEYSNLGVSKLQAALVCALELLDETYRLKLEIEDIKNG